MPDAADACPACGLARDRFAGFALADVPSEVIAAWARVEAAWDDDARHAEFADVAGRHGALDHAIRAYRRAGREADPHAVAVRARILKQAEVALASAATVRTQRGMDEPYRKVLLLVIALLLAGGVLGVYALTRVGRPDGPVPEPASEAPRDAPARP